MPKKSWTEAERKAFAEKMKAARAAKTKEVKEDKEDTKSANQEIEELKKQIEELKNNNFFADFAKAMKGTQQAVKAITKYSINPKDYPDPRDRLKQEPRLKSEAFEHNFVMDWEVGKVNYDAKDGVNYTEPKFRLELWRWVRDPKTNEITNKKFLVKKVTLFEDPDAAIQAAIAAGETVPEEMEKAFLDEMRYLRVRDWVYDIFFPSPPKFQGGIREEVIGNRLVRVLETSSTEALDMPFHKL